MFYRDYRCVVCGKTSHVGVYVPFWSWYDENHKLISKIPDGTTYIDIPNDTDPGNFRCLPCLTELAELDRVTKSVELASKNAELDDDRAKLVKRIDSLERQVEHFREIERERSVAKCPPPPVRYETANDRYWSDYAAMSPEKKQEVMRQRREERERTEERRRGEWNGN